MLDVLQQITNAPAILAHEPSRRRLQDGVINMLVELMQEGDPDRLPPPSTRSYIVDEAIELIDARLTEPIGLGDICRAIRVSPRTLRYSFNDIIGVAPMRYIISRRLHGVRAELRRSSSTAAIQEIAFRWGFWHMSRFASFYRQTFGELPSETLCAGPFEDRLRGGAQDL